MSCGIVSKYTRRVHGPLPRTHRALGSGIGKRTKSANTIRQANVPGRGSQLRGCFRSALMGSICIPCSRDDAARLCSNELLRCDRNSLRHRTHFVHHCDIMIVRHLRAHGIYLCPCHISHVSPAVRMVGHDDIIRSSKHQLITGLTRKATYIGLMPLPRESLVLGLDIGRCCIAALAKSWFRGEDRVVCRASRRLAHADSDAWIWHTFARLRRIVVDEPRYYDDIQPPLARGRNDSRTT